MLEAVAEKALLQLRSTWAVHTVLAVLMGNRVGKICSTCWCILVARGTMLITHLKVLV